MVLKELGGNNSKNRSHAVAKCLGMFKEKFKEAKKSNASLTEEQFAANFDWDTCPECVQKEKEINKKLGLFELDIPNNNF